MGSGKEKIISIKGLRIDYRGLAHLSIQNLIKNPALKGGRVIHALRGVDLEVEKGEILGIIGENGAGKSTLLKAVAGIFQPDEGSIDTHGNRVSLMSLGVGFKWDLSGRDNIMLAGLLLRYPKQYIRDKMQEIIDFSELGDAIDRPVRTYSSGMYSKLSFAITAVLETDVMLIDELLSVGDESFQGKSYRKIRELVSRDGMTGIIVSHDMELIKDMCTRVIWLSDGRIQASGDPVEMTEMYIRASAASGAQKLTVEEAVVSDPGKDVLLYRGLCVNERSGLLEESSEGKRCAVNWEPVRLMKGDRLFLKSEDVLCRTFFYEDRIAPELIYTKTRSPEGLRCTYCAEGSGLFWQDRTFDVPADGWYRFELLKKGEQIFGEHAAFLEDVMELPEKPSEGYEKDKERRERIFGKALSEAAMRAEVLKGADDPLIILLADTHFAFGGTWDDTAYCIRELSLRLMPDAVVHLGDITDGTYPPVLFRKVSEGMMDALGSSCHAYLCAGNHDLEMSERLSASGAATDYAGVPVIRSSGRRFADVPGKKLRMVFLSSFDPAEKISYGFSSKDAEWLRETVMSMPEGFRAAVFSHIDPSSEETSWGEPVRGGSLICRALKDVLKSRPGSIYAVFCGHDHRDRIRHMAGFDIVSTGSASLTDYTGCRPLYDGKYSRRPDDTSQELFDIVVLHSRTGGADLIRFGAGEDRKAGTDD